jgi:hypothetical protein
MENIREKISEHNPDAILFDDLDDAIIGVGQQHGRNRVAIYDRNKCIEIFAEQFKDGEDPYLTAIEWFEFNVENAYVGKNTPIFMESLK